jgi:hypothetical protein
MELVLKIISNLNHEQQYATIAKLAQVDSTYYKLVMPILYRTIIIDTTNTMELDFGNGTSTSESQMPIPHVSGLDGDWGTRDGTAPEMGLTSGSHRIPAEGYCLRLIVDVAIDNIPDSLDRVFDRLCNRFTNVTEIVFTRRTLQDIQPIDQFTDDPLGNLSPRTSLNANPDNISISIRKTMRVVLHLPPNLGLHRNGNALWQLSRWSRGRPALRASIQFVVYGMNLYGPVFDLYCMDVECHSGPSAMPPGAFEHALAQWLFNLFLKGRHLHASSTSTLRHPLARFQG